MILQIFFSNGAVTTAEYESITIDGADVFVKDKYEHINIAERAESIYWMECGERKLLWRKNEEHANDQQTT